MSPMKTKQVIRHGSLKPRHLSGIEVNKVHKIFN